jgi:hypothetical protein
MNGSDIFGELVLDEDKKKEIPQFMINPNGFFKSTWNIMILILVIFQSVVIPVRIAFEGEILVQWKITDYILDSIFLIDIFINFLTALEDDSGDYIINRKVIAKDYLFSWFFIDFVSCIPITFIMEFFYSGLKSSAKANTSKFLKLMKIPRIFRILRVIKMIKIFNRAKQLAKIVENINLSSETKSIYVSLILMCFLLHMVGCFFAVAANISSDLGLVNWVEDNGLSDEMILSKYLACLYWAAVSISTVGYGDILPTNPIEITVEIFLVFSGVAMYSYIVSKLSNLFSSTTGVGQDF